MGFVIREGRPGDMGGSKKSHTNMTSKKKGGSNWDLLGEKPSGGWKEFSGKAGTKKGTEKRTKKRAY